MLWITNKDNTRRLIMIWTGLSALSGQRTDQCLESQQSSEQTFALSFLSVFDEALAAFSNDEESRALFTNFPALGQLIRQI